jgi:hypothetical protein
VKGSKRFPQIPGYQLVFAGTYCSRLLDRTTYAINKNASGDTIVTSSPVRERGVGVLFAMTILIVISGCNPAPPPTPLQSPPSTYCGDSNWTGRYQEAPDGIDHGVRAASYFYRDCIQPIWTVQCEACHSANSWGEWQHNLILKMQDGDTRESKLFTSYEQLVGVPGRVVPGDDGDSAGRLLQSLTRVGGFRKMHFWCEATGGTCLPASEMEKIKRWIKNLPS